MKKSTPEFTDPVLIRHYRAILLNPLTVEGFQDITQNGYAKRSCVAMVKDWNLFLEFCQLKQVSALPASTTAIRLFLEKEARSRKFSTLRRYSITISNIHKLSGYSDPTRTQPIRQLLMQLRIDKHGDGKQAETFTAAHLTQLHQALIQSDEIKDIRDLAIYHVMFECALKRGELKQLDITQCVYQNDSVVITINETDYQLSEPGQAAFLRWQQLLALDAGPLFRGINRHGHISSSPLDDSSIYRVLRHAGERLGQPGLKFSGQSTRIGAVQELSKQGYKAREIQAFGRWLSAAMPYQYLGQTNTAEREKMKFLSIKPWN
ncbi:MAG: tyrosine-type recombinase/integrase [Vibrio sp.]